eukprot:TRINITY_DN5581_c0_g1_i1.p1 TRINITY_DN5581_c0_g1~~TRINITY_DN5581_c0_g1_i1.p1  ORF type:complete len:110 (-),score=49.82 TRINITY_DN5581_c0_g1_i1:92-421(-)
MTTPISQTFVRVLNLLKRVGPVNRNNLWKEYKDEIGLPSKRKQKMILRTLTFHKWATVSKVPTNKKEFEFQYKVINEGKDFHPLRKAQLSANSTPSQLDTSNSVENPFA